MVPYCTRILWIPVFKLQPLPVHLTELQLGEVFDRWEVLEHSTALLVDIGSEGLEPTE